MSNNTTPVCFSVDEFVARNRISRGLLYKEWRAGRGPRVMKIGIRTLITEEAEREWHRRMEMKPEVGAAE